ncbi:FAD/NAD-binding domain-containing protein [Phanerochaete sordida]|uniref:FAD/NAD-binding domain-containing protein n=1 Tax=Phanerochaete sordida TaxID=48140 RepID=A0A9P3LGC1_9APHY|nr:FAD/NAD-binding domain-containing protein [Phanerochaete sordida]
MAHPAAFISPDTARDPVNYFAQRLVADSHIQLGRPFPAAAPEVEARTQQFVFNANKYLDRTGAPVLQLPSQFSDVAIVGGGIGGLYAALILQDLDVAYTIYEASERLGGRLYTYKGFLGSGNPWDYFDIGAMRFPDTEIMAPVKRLIDFLNLEKLEYLMEDRHGNSTRCFNQVVTQRSDKIITPQDYNVSSEDVPDRWGQLGVAANVSNVVKPFRDLLEQDVKHRGQDGMYTMLRYDIYSTRAYMTARRSDYEPRNILDEKNLMPYPTTVVDWCETFDHSSWSYDRALTETVLDSMVFTYRDDPNVPTKWYCIKDGSSELATKLNDYLSKSSKHKLKTRTRVTGIRWHKSNNSVNVLTERGDEIAYGHVITTTTLPCLRAMDLSDAGLDARRWGLIRSLSYGAATKIGVKFRSAWWQDHAFMCDAGAFGAVVGGQSFTDNMSRRVVYPSYGVDGNSPSTVLLASYAATGDAQAWTGLTAKEAKPMVKRRVIDDLVAVHRFNDFGPKVLEEEWEDAFLYSWNTDPNTMGAYAFFGPGQFPQMYRDLTCPAAGGKLHFAGEAISARHAWVIGALQASHRAVYQIIASSFPSKLDLLEQRWGLPEAWTHRSLMEQVAVTMEGFHRTQ